MKSFDLKKYNKILDYIIIFLFICITIYLAHTLGNYYSTFLMFSPINGTFQIFNPLYRMNLGQVPFLDFDLYLGLGVTYFNYLFFFFTDHSFAASNYIANFINVAIFSIFGYFLGRLGLSKKITIFIIALQIFTTFFSHNYFGIHSLDSIIRTTFASNHTLLVYADYSLFGLRSGLPFIYGFIIWFLFFKTKFLKNYYITAIIFGFLTGIAPLWSNDYGFSTALVTSLMFLLFFLDKKNYFIKSISLFSIASITSFILIGSILTGNSLIEWYNYNFNGVSKDQFWYFASPEQKLLLASDILYNNYIFTFIVSSIVIFAYAIRSNKDEIKIKNLIIVFIAISTLLSAYISASFGSNGSRYFIAVYRILPFIFIYAVFLLFSKFELVKIKEKFNFLLGISTILVLFYFPLSLDKMKAYFFQQPSSENFFYVEELGGYFSNQYKEIVEIAREIKQKADAGDIGKQHRLFSTYATAMDVISGSLHPARNDYIIHALGDAQRKQYVQALLDSQPLYVTTIRRSWEGWIRILNWYFYDALLREGYYPVIHTFYNSLWQKQNEPHAFKTEDIDATCKIHVLSEHETRLVFQITSEVPFQDKLHYLELSLDYETSWIYPERFYALGLQKHLSVLNNGMPPQAQDWKLPVVVHGKNKGHRDLSLKPEASTQLNVKKCKARYVMPHHILDPQSLVPANFTDVNWANGIFILNKEKSGFFISDITQLKGVKEGMSLNFRHSGVRKIKQIIQHQIWVEGLPLDPVADGYPHEVIVQP